MSDTFAIWIGRTLKFTVVATLSIVLIAAAASVWLGAEALRIYAPLREGFHA